MTLNFRIIAQAANIYHKLCCATSSACIVINSIIFLASLTVASSSHLCVLYAFLLSLLRLVIADDDILYIQPPPNTLPLINWRNNTARTEILFVYFIWIICHQGINKYYRGTSTYPRGMRECAFLISKMFKMIYVHRARKVLYIHCIVRIKFSAELLIYSSAYDSCVYNLVWAQCAF